MSSGWQHLPLARHWHGNPCKLASRQQGMLSDSQSIYCIGLAFALSFRSAVNGWSASQPLPHEMLHSMPLTWQFLQNGRKLGNGGRQSAADSHELSHFAWMSTVGQVHSAYHMSCSAIWQSTSTRCSQHQNEPNSSTLAIPVSSVHSHQLRVETAASSILQGWPGRSSRAISCSRWLMQQPLPR